MEHEPLSPWRLPGYEGNKPDRRVMVSLHTAPVMCGDRGDVHTEFGNEVGGLPTVRLVVSAWARDADAAEGLARRLLTGLRDALTAELESLPTVSKGDTP